MNHSRIPCKKCGMPVLPALYEDYKGLCWTCFQGMERITCDSCGRETLIHNSSLQEYNLCLHCKAAGDYGEIWTDWDERHSIDSYPYDLDTVRIKLFPDFKEVFVDESLKGYFYPMCTLKLKGKESGEDTILHVISHNGLWIAEETPLLNSEYCILDIVNGKYQFNGQLSSLSSSPELKKIYTLLLSHFENNNELWEDSPGHFDKFKEETSFVNILATKEFDIDYYVETFYSYFAKRKAYLNLHPDHDFISINDLEDEEAFRSFPSHWFIEMAIDPILTHNDLLMNALPIGACPGYVYFFDGNYSVLFYDKKNSRIINTNYYD